MVFWILLIVEKSADSMYYLKDMFKQVMRESEH